MAHNILEANAAAQDVNVYSRFAKAAVDVDNGNILILNGLTGASGEKEVFSALVPSTANGLAGVWMASEPEAVITGGKYKNIDPDVRNFFIASGTVFTCFKPQVGDLLGFTADGLAGTKSTNEFVNATDTTGGLKPVWGATQTASVFSMKLVETSYFSIGTGAVDSQRVTKYTFEVLAN